MSKVLLVSIGTFFLVSLSSGKELEEPGRISWMDQTEIPSIQSGSHPGLAGAFSGVHDDAIIIAGGANFPQKSPWEGGEKVWWDQVFVLTKDSVFHLETSVDVHLDKPAAYGISLATEAGLICLGGGNKSGLVSDITLLRWNPGSQSLTSKRLGELPLDFQVTAGFLSDGFAFVLGINESSNQLIRIGLEELLDGRVTPDSWRQIQDCPGPARQMPAYAVQSDGESDFLCVFGGRSVSDNGLEILDDGYLFNLRENQWERVIQCPPVMAAPALSYGANTVLIFGGDDGELLLERNKLETLISLSPNQRVLDSLSALLKASFMEHPGFSQHIYSFNTITKTFQRIGDMPFTSPVTTNAFQWDDWIVLPSGEIKPGIRTPAIQLGKIITSSVTFGWLNYFVLGCYFLLLVGIGFFFAKRQKSTNDYFKGGGRVPWWAAGLSVFGTALSAITFMAIPAKTFATDWTYFFYNPTVLLGMPIVVFIFIPFYRKLNITTAYEYLEVRFNVVVRLFGSFSFILYQLGRIAIVLYLPAIALSLVTGIDIYLCILVVGVFSVVYTLIGGIEAVIWTDVVQVIVLMGGALLTLVMVGFELSWNFDGLLTHAIDEGKLDIIKTGFSLNDSTIWVVVIGGFFANLITYSSDQTIVQRYLTTKDEKGAVKTAWTNAWLMIPSTLIFFSVGTCLYLFYTEYPQRLDAFSTNTDAIFPWFIVHELPNGVSGLLIAGLFSAAMSSLSSSINSSSTVFTTDFVKRFRPTISAKAEMSTARISTLLTGILGISFALWMASADVSSLWDQYFKVLGLFTGGLGGVFLLGILFERANAAGAIFGLVVSCIIQYLISTYTDVHVFLYATSGVVSCVLGGYIFSLILHSVVPGNTK